MKKESLEKFFREEDKAALMKAIQEAEKQTSGEIRVHLQQSCKTDPMEEAKKVFEHLGMTRTEKRNGILFFLSLQDHHFVILGDTGIHEKVKEDFWHAIRNRVLDHFKKGEYVAGLEGGIKKCGEKLREYFPYLEGDKNELGDDVSAF